MTNSIHSFFPLPVDDLFLSEQDASTFLRDRGGTDEAKEARDDRMREVAENRREDAGKTSREKDSETLENSRERRHEL